MSYLRFEKAVMTNLEESLHRELLRSCEQTVLAPIVHLLS